MDRKTGYITRQAKRLRDGEINRRRFVMHALSAGVTMPTAMSLAHRAEAAVPRKGGLLRQAVDPIELTRHAARLTANTLTARGDEGEIVGELAAHISMSQNGKVWRFKLRGGVEFQNGQPLTPEAVVESFANLRRKQSVLSNIARIDVQDESVIIRLHVSDVTFAERLSAPEVAIRTPDGNGTGAYQADTSTPGRFLRNPNYWKSDAAHFEAVDLIAMPDVKARQSALINGEVDLVHQIDLHNVALIQRVPTLDIAEHVGTELLGFAFCEAAASKDRNSLQQILSSLIPRQLLVDKVLLGHGRAAPGQYDPQAAAIAYARADYQGPYWLAASDEAFAGATHTARILADEAAKIGIDLRVTRDPSAADVHTAVLPQGGDRELGAYFANHVLAFDKRLAGQNTTRHDRLRIAERWWFK